MDFTALLCAPLLWNPLITALLQGIYKIIGIITLHSLQALLNTSLGDTWHLKYDRRKSVNNAVSYDVNINKPLPPERENDEKLLQEIRNRKLEALNEKQRRAQQRRKVWHNNYNINEFSIFYYL